MVALEVAHQDELEDELEEERQEPNLVAPAFMRQSARRGLRLHEEGYSGDGLKPQTVEDARKMAESTALSEDKWRRIGPWIARHTGDLDAVGAGEITPGLVAMLLWGGGSSKSSARRAQDYAERLVARLDEKRYDPDQPRDEDGKFGSGGGGGGSDDDGEEGDGGESGDDSEFGETTEQAMRQEEKVQEQQAEYVDSLDTIQQDAIVNYTGEGYRDINKFYRGAPPPPLTDEQIAELDYTTAMLESAVMEAPPLAAPVTVYRGMTPVALGLDKFESDDQAYQELVGTTFKDEGFVSTSFSPDATEGFGGQNAVTLEITAPAGSAGLAVGSISENFTEFEFLMPPGREFEITGTRMVGNQRILEVTVIN